MVSSDDDDMPELEELEDKLQNVTSHDQKSQSNGLSIMKDNKFTDFAQNRSNDYE